MRATNAFISWIIAAFWWLVDKLYGDKIFTLLQPVLPEWITNPPVAKYVPYAITYGPFAALVLLGGYLFWTSRNAAQPERPPPPPSKERQLPYKLL